MNKYFIITILIAVLCNCSQNQRDVAEEKAVVIEGGTPFPNERGFIKNWTISGMFPSPEVDAQLPDGSWHLGFHKDYLESIGGEQETVLSPDTIIKYTTQNGETDSVVTKDIMASNSGIVNLDSIFDQPDNVVAYAYSSIHSDRDQEVMFLLGSDDGVKVWVNGELVHKNYVGRGLTLGQDNFDAKLHKGDNRILVKVIDMVRDWGFAIEMLDEESAAIEKQAQRDKAAVIASKIPEEKLLWPNGIENNQITYEVSNIMKTGSWHPDAPLQISRGYSNVSIPTYHIFKPTSELNTGVAVVILPGGGYHDVWMDSEGHNIALTLAESGITSLVMKYRTNSTDENGKQPLSWDDYILIAVEDAKEGIRILRSQAEEHNLDPNKIGIGGFSAGAHLSLSVCVNPDTKANYPDFTFLIYPWLQENSNEQVMNSNELPPMFIVNGQPDTSTPADLCAQFYYILCQKEVPAELHIYGKGDHGFGLGLGAGKSTVQWTNSFVAWLEDINMIKHE